MRQAPSPTTVNTIAVSPDVMTGMVFGVFLIGVLLFALSMLMNIQSSDRIGQAPPGKEEKAH